MTVLHSGTTKQYSSNWDVAFGKKRPAATAQMSTKKKAGKKAPGKKARRHQSGAGK
jgi:hypothetical protein